MSSATRPPSLTCPCCYREMHVICCDNNCVCHDIPEDELPMVNLDNDAEACHYCGFAAHIDFWSERNMAEAQLLPNWLDLQVTP